MNPARTEVRLCSFSLIILVILTIAVNAASVFGSVTMAWDPNSESYLAGYNVYRSNQSGVYTSPPLNGATLLTATTFADSTVLNNQTYYYAIRAVGTGGQESANSNEILVVTTGPDIVPPSVSLTAPATGATVSGSAVTISATAADNVGVAGVQFKLDGVNLNAEDTTSPYSTVWNTTTLSNGSHTLSGVARDAAGNQTTASSVTVTVSNADTTPPTVSLTAPTGGSTVLGSVTVSANAADNVGVAGVQFKLDGANLGAEDTTSPYSISWTTTTATNATHTLAAVARDAAGNTTTSASVSVTVNNPDLIAPTVSLTAPTGGSMVLGSVTVSANAADNVGVAGVQFKLDGANLGAEDTTSPYSISWTTTTATNASHTLTAVARDAAGNLTTSASVSVTVNNSDIVAPTVSLTAPTGGSTVSGSVTVSANAADNVGVAGVQFKLDGANLGAEDTTSPYSISWITTTATNASHTLTAVARDAAGNTATSAAVSVTVNNPDIIAPTVSLASPTGGSTVLGSVTVSANAADNVGVAGVQFKLDGVNLGAESTSAPYSTLWTTTTATNASHTLTAVARDAAGNLTTSASVSVTVNNSDITAPTVSLTAPTGGSTVLGSVTVSANAADNVGVAGVQFKLDGANLGAESTSAPYSTSWTTTTAANGSHALTAVARDAAGNTAASASVSVTVNNSDIIAPTVFLTAPTGGSTVLGSITVSANASDNVGVVGVQFKLDGANVGAESTSAPYSVSWNTTTATNASHMLTAVARDAAGNTTTSASVSVTVNSADTTAPTVSITAPTTGSTVSGPITVSANASDNVGVAGVQFKLDGANVGAESASAPYTTLLDTTAVTNGAHTLAAVARDAAGNQTTSAAVIVTVSNSAATQSTTTFSIASVGGESWGTNGTSQSPTIEYAHLQQDTGNSALSGLAIFGFRLNGVLVTEAGVPATAPIYSGRTYVEVNGPVNTGVAFANPGSQDAVISFYFTDAGGTNFGQGSFTLAAQRQVAAFLNQAPYNGGSAMQGTFTFSSSIPVGVIALRGFTNERSEFLITTLPVAAVGGTNSNVLVLAHFADGGGWTTQVVLTNSTDGPINGTVQFLGQGAVGQNAPDLSLSVNGAVGSSFPYAIPPRSAFRLVTGNAGAQTQVGSLHITPAAGASPAATAIFSFQSNGVTVTEAGVSAQPISTAFRVYAESSGGLSDIGSIQTGAAIANSSAAPVTVTLELIRMDGSSALPPITVTVPANGQIAKFISQLFTGLPTTFQGFLKVNSSAPVAVTGLRGRYNERSDFLITTTPPQNVDVALPVSQLIFPHIVSGGGYTTQFIIAGQSTSGRLWLNSQDGGVLPDSSLQRIP